MPSRLGVVAYDGESTAGRLWCRQDQCLQAVCVLIFVDEDMIPLGADLVGKPHLI